MQTTSENGIAFLRLKEGTVLKAYRDSAGVLTIGDGLTKASGVIDPKPGMVITMAQATDLLHKALARNYEPRVRKRLGVVPQHVFDGSVSFDWNTGAIDTASWVKSFLAGAAPSATRTKIMLWIKGGGKVLPGLQKRRGEEADIILLNKWPASLKVASPADPQKYATFVVAVTATEIQSIREGFQQIGFEPGGEPGYVLRAAVEDFQRRYDLIVDGKIGNATLATLQRELDARKKVSNAVITTAGSGAAAGGNEAIAPDVSSVPDVTVDPALVTWVCVGIGAIALIYLGYLAWHYRDMIAPRVQKRFPKLAAWLRSF